MLVNKNYTINFGTSTLEYNNIGGGTSYSMWGDEFPIKPSDVNPWTQPLLTSEDDLYGSYYNTQQITRRFMGGREFAVECSSTWNDGDRSIYKAFNGDKPDIDNMNELILGRSLPFWVAFYNPNPLNVTKIVAYAGHPTNTDGNGTLGIKDYQIQGSNDGINWTNIKTGEMSLDNEHLTNFYVYTFDMPNNTVFYKYHRIYVTSIYGTGYIYSNTVVAVKEIEITASERQESITGTFVQPDFPIDPTRGLTTYTKDGFTITVSSHYGTDINLGYLSRMSCDYGENFWYSSGNGPTGWMSYIGNTQWVEYEYRQPLKLKGITVYNGNNYSIIKDYKVDYWANDTWNTIKTGVNNDSGVLHAWYIDLENTTISSTKWRLYRLSGYSSVNNYTGIFKAVLNADNMGAKQFIQPVFTQEDGGFESTECTKDNFTIYADSFYSSEEDPAHYGVAQAFDGNHTPNGQGNFDANNAWHSGYDGNREHYIGFRYNKPLKVYNLTVYNGPTNVTPYDWTLQCKINNEFVTVTSGTNNTTRAGDSWIISTNGTYISNDWRILMSSSTSAISPNYVGVLEIEIDAEIVE